MQQTLAPSASRPAGTRFRSSLALGFTSLGLAAAGAWLLVVSVTVVPVHDPARVGFWRIVGGTMLALAAFGLAALRPGSRGAVERVGLGIAGGAAAGVGLGALLREMVLARGEGHFEGYLLVLALVLASHGIAALAFALAAGPERP